MHTAKTADGINNVLSQLMDMKVEVTLAAKVDKQFKYFDLVKKTAGTLNQEARAASHD